jgi:hypothetical protein
MVVQGGVSSDRVVERFDVLEDRRGEFGSGTPGSAVEQFDLHGAEERFDHRVVKGARRCAHRADQASFPESVAEQPAGVLTRFKRSAQHLK